MLGTLRPPRCCGLSNRPSPDRWGSGHTRSTVARESPRSDDASRRSGRPPREGTKRARVASVSVVPGNARGATESCQTDRARRVRRCSHSSVVLPATPGWGSPRVETTLIRSRLVRSSLLLAVGWRARAFACSGASRSRPETRAVRSGRLRAPMSVARGRCPGGGRGRDLTPVRRRRRASGRRRSSRWRLISLVDEPRHHAGYRRPWRLRAVGSVVAWAVPLR